MEERNKKNKYFKSLHFTTQKYFIKAGFFPRTPDEADKFVKKNCDFANNEPFCVKYLDNTTNTEKNIVISKQNYYDAFYCDIYNTLHVDETLCVYKWAVETYCKKFGMNSMEIMLFNEDSVFSLGSVSSNTNEIFLNFYCAINFDFTSYDMLSTIVHELTHKKQEIISNNLYKTAKTNLNSYERSFLAFDTSVIEYTFNNTDDFKLTTSNENLIKKYKNIKDRKKFYNFLYNSYSKNYSESQAREAGEKRVDNIHSYFKYKFGSSNVLDNYYNYFREGVDFDNEQYKIVEKKYPNYIKNINNFSVELNNLIENKSAIQDLYDLNDEKLSDKEYFEFRAKNNVPYVWCTKAQVDCAKYSYKENSTNKKIDVALKDIIDFYENNVAPKNLDERVDNEYKEYLKLSKEYDKHENDFTDEKNK